MARGWLVSPAFDLGLMLGPGAAAVALALALPDAALPPWGYVAFVLGVDVAHVYASLYRTYLDPDTRARRRPLLLGAPLAATLACCALYGLAAPLFWTALAYLAVFHFVKQQVGVAALYRVREGLPTRDAAARVERALIYGVTLSPILWWHAHLPRAFDWFLPGDFLVGLPPWVAAAAIAGTAALALLHLGLRLRSRRPAPGRDLWVGLTALVWFTGMVLCDGDLAFTATNVVNHGVPYLALVAWTTHRQWRLTGRGPAVAAWFQPAGALRYLAPLLLLAFLEEGLWDGLVWHDHPWLFGAWDTPPALLAALAVPLLSVPQVTHYLLDGFIWKLGPENPGLRALLAPDPVAAP